MPDHKLPEWVGETWSAECIYCRGRGMTELDCCPKCGGKGRVQVVCESDIPAIEAAAVERERERIVKLEAALRPVAELADRLKAKGHLDLDPDYQFATDPDLTFPSNVELSITDLRRALAANRSDTEEEGES